MEWVKIAQDLWWVIALIVAAIAFIARTSIKTDKILGQVAIVKQHEGQIKQIKEDIEGLAEGVGNLTEALDTHVVDQKGDIKAINKGLLAIMEQMLHPRESKQKLEQARDELQNRLIEK